VNNKIHSQKVKEVNFSLFATINSFNNLAAQERMRTSKISLIFRTFAEICDKNFDQSLILL